MDLVPADRDNVFEISRSVSRAIEGSNDFRFGIPAIRIQTDAFLRLAT
jgi:hypothetical protein